MVDQGGDGVEKRDSELSAKAGRMSLPGRGVGEIEVSFAGSVRILVCVRPY
jgi:hypothetical protein